MVFFQKHPHASGLICILAAALVSPGGNAQPEALIPAAPGGPRDRDRRGAECRQIVAIGPEANPAGGFRGGPGVGSAAPVEDTRDDEKSVWHELNLVRTDPAGYARRYLDPRRKRYLGKLYQQSGGVDVLTEEGLEALEECIAVLRETAAVPRLSYSSGLARAARDHVQDQGRTGRTGHEGSDESSSRTRVERYGRWRSVVGENIFYGSSDPREIVIQLLVDDGVPDRGHRSNILNPAFRVVGVAIGPHTLYRWMCVMDFAGSFAEQAHRR